MSTATHYGPETESYFQIAAREAIAHNPTLRGILWQMENYRAGGGYPKCDNCGKDYNEHGAAIVDAQRLHVPEYIRHLICREKAGVGSRSNSQGAHYARAAGLLTGIALMALAALPVRAHACIIEVCSSGYTTLGDANSDLNSQPDFTLTRPHMIGATANGTYFIEFQIPVKQKGSLCYGVWESSEPPCSSSTPGATSAIDGTVNATVRDSDGYYHNTAVAKVKQ